MSILTRPNHYGGTDLTTLTLTLRPQDSSGRTTWNEVVNLERTVDIQRQLPCYLRCTLLFITP